MLVVIFFRAGGDGWFVGYHSLVGAHFNLPEHSIEDFIILAVEKIQF